MHNNKEKTTITKQQRIKKMILHPLKFQREMDFDDFILCVELMTVCLTYLYLSNLLQLRAAFLF